MKRKNIIIILVSKWSLFGALVSSVIHDKPAEIVDIVRHLGSGFDCQLKQNVNTEHILNVASK